MAVLFVAIMLVQIYLVSKCFANWMKEYYEICFFVSCGLTLLFDITIVYILAYVSSYSIEKEIVIMSISVVILVLICILNKYKNKIKFSKQLVLLIVVGFCVFIFNSLFRVERATGWRDNSGYYCEAIHIAKSGSIFYNNVDELRIDEENELEMATTFSYAGLSQPDGYSDSSYSSWVVQYYPCALALFYDLFGVNGMGYVGAVFSAIICVLLILYLQRLFSSLVSYFVAFSVILNPAEIWASRITLAEIFCQYILLLAFIIYAMDTHSKKCIAISAVVVAFSIVAKMDMLVVIAGILLWWLACLLFEDEISGITRYVKCVLCASTIAFIALCGTSRYYLIIHWQKGYLNKILFLIFFLTFCGNMVYFYRKRTGKLPINKGNIVEKIEINKKNMGAWFVCLMLLISLLLKTGHLWQVKVLFMQSWYVSLPIIIFAPIGIVYYFKDNKELQNSISIWIGFLFWGVYTYSASASDDHMWISRRWVTVIIPFLIILGFYFLYRIIGSKIVTIALSLIMIVWSIYQSRGFIVSNIMDGCMSMNEEMADNMLEDIYFCENQYISAVLFGGYGKHIYTLDGENVEEYILNHGPITFIGSENYLSVFFEETDVRWKLLEKNRKKMYDLENSKEGIPTQYIQTVVDYSQYELYVE